jgi:starch synthase
MKIVMAAAECVPFVKAGGLADVMGALPKALVEIGCEVTVVLPKYSLIPQEYQKEFTLGEEVDVPFKGQNHHCRTFNFVHKGVDYIFVENDFYYDRDLI